MEPEIVFSEQQVKPNIITPYKSCKILDGDNIIIGPNVYALKPETNRFFTLHRRLDKVAYKVEEDFQNIEVGYPLFNNV